MNTDYFFKPLRNYPLLPLFLLILVCSLTCSCSNPSPHSSSSSQQKNFARIATMDDPTALDPRFTRDLKGATVSRMLFEGLMRTTTGGKLIPGIAEKVSISDDHKTYTFHLRPSVWSDGTPLLAEDFMQTWQSSLSPSVPAQNAYQLYLIKGARQAKEGKLPVSEIGVTAPTPLTLVVELESPTPYFLEMTSCHFFFPVHPIARASSDSLPPEQIIGNGPFKLDSWVPRSEFNVAKNPLYWEANQIALDGISLQVLDENTALQLFKAHQLDWAGSPLSTLPQDAIAPLKEQNMLQIMPGAGTHWVRINTEKAPFHNEKIRRAFGLAINRQAIVDHITQGNQQPALGIIPPSFGTPLYDDYQDHDITKAKALFEEALIEENLSRSTLPPLELTYASSDRNHKIAQALQQQWNQLFGIDVRLGCCEIQVHIDKVKRGDHLISLGSWYADFRDPINFLEIFYSKNTPTNQTFWQNSFYQKLIDQASQETDPEKRLQHLASAEKILLDSMPILPIFYPAYNFLKNEQLEGIYFSPLGYLDFKQAKLKTP